MFVQYGNPPVAMQCEQILEFSQTPVMSEDGVDFLYCHIRLRVRAVWNPALTHATDDDGAMVAAASIEELRHQLMQPRQHLKVRVPSGGNASSNILVSSPMLNPAGLRYPCDAKNGPFPIGMPIITVIGERTAIVEWACETFVNECPNGIPLISHRWQAVHDVDEHFYTTRTVQGIAIFRTDVMQNKQFLPDDFRSWLLHPVPWGFKRQKILVEAASDGTALRYTVVDQEMPLIAASGDKGITRVEGSYTYHKGISTLSTANMVAGARAGSRMGGGRGAAVGAFLGAMGDLVGVFPPSTCRLNARVWGEKATTRTTLLNALTRIVAAFRLDGDNGQGLGGVARGLISFTMVDKVITCDIFGKYAEITATLRMPSEVNAALAIAPPLQALFPPNLAVGGATLPEDIGNMFTATVNDGHAPKTDSGSRGNYIAHLAHQALSTPCTGPAGPDPDGVEKENAARLRASDT